MKKRKPLTDEEGEVRELLMEDIRRFRPMTEGLSSSLAAKLGIKIPSAPPAPAKERTTIRLSRDVLRRFRASGPGWQTQLDAALREWLDTHSPGKNIYGPTAIKLVIGVGLSWLEGCTGSYLSNTMPQVPSWSSLGGSTWI